MRSTSAGTNRVPVSIRPIAETVQPQGAIRIDHHFDDGRVEQRRGNIRAHSRAQHVAAAVAAFGF